MLMYHADFLQKVALPTVTIHLLVSMRVISHLATLLQNKYIGRVLVLFVFQLCILHLSWHLNSVTTRWLFCKLVLSHIALNPLSLKL